MNKQYLLMSLAYMYVILLFPGLDAGVSGLSVNLDGLIYANRPRSTSPTLQPNASPMPTSYDLSMAVNDSLFDGRSLLCTFNEALREQRSSWERLPIVRSDACTIAAINAAMGSLAVARGIDAHGRVFIAARLELSGHCQKSLNGEYYMILHQREVGSTDWNIQVPEVFESIFTHTAPYELACLIAIGQRAYLMNDAFVNITLKPYDS